MVFIIIYCNFYQRIRLQTIQIVLISRLCQQEGIVCLLATMQSIRVRYLLQRYRALSGCISIHSPACDKRRSALSTEEVQFQRSPNRHNNAYIRYRFFRMLQIFLFYNSAKDNDFSYLCESLSNNIFQFYGLKRNMSYTTFIKDADSFFINHGKTSISPVVVLIQQQLMFR